MSAQTISLPTVFVNTFRKSSPLSAKVIENRQLFSKGDPENEAKHIVLEISGMSYLEGQSVGVLTPGINEKGKPHAVRLYSIASPGSDIGEANKVALCVKRLIYTDPETQEKKRGIASNYLCDLKAGDKVNLTGPAGRHFLLPVEEEIQRPYLFFATGTGIAPFLGMLYRLLAKGRSPQKDIFLFLGVKRQSELIYNEELAAYAEYDNFHYRFALSREQKNSKGGKLYLHDLIDNSNERKDQIIDTVNDPETLIYICGLKGMETNIYKKLAELISKPLESPEFQEFVKTRVITEVY